MLVRWSLVEERIGISHGLERSGVSGQTGGRMRRPIRITDLVDPELAERQVTLRGLAEQFPVTFSVDAILDAARQRTGMADFGSDDFVDRLDVLCLAVDEDTSLAASGRAGVHADFVRYASNRLLIRELLSRHPEIHRVEIAAPIVVAGLPRSGTTHLLNLMAADQRFRSLPYWESCEPVPSPRDESTVHGEDPRYTRSREAWELTDQVLPLLKAMHATTPDHIHEELELMGPDFASYNFEWRFHAPRWRDHYRAHDQTPHYESMKTVLKVLQWQDTRQGQPPRRWVLKCPQHMEQLPVLHATFPDATIVITHRDPSSVIASASTMTSYGDRMRCITPDPVRTARYWTDRVETLLRACVRDRDSVPADQSVDVRFRGFMADDLGTVEEIYAMAGVDMTVTAGAELAAYMDENPRGRHGRIVYDLAADFGLDRAELRERFRFYTDRFGVQEEGGS